MNILVVEDNELLRHHLSERLSGCGFCVLSAHDGGEALYLDRELDVEVAIIELGLPGGVDGFELIGHLRDAARAYPILVLTARGNWEDKVAALQMGADDYVVKPCCFFFAMISTYRSWLEDALRKRLVADARTVITAAQWLDGNLVISDRLEDARFDTLESDFVAIVYDRDEQLLWRSASTGDFFPDYLPEAWSREGCFFRFDTGANQPDYFLYELEFRLGGQSFSVITGEDVEEIDAGV